MIRSLRTTSPQKHSSAVVFFSAVLRYTVNSWNLGLKQQHIWSLQTEMLYMFICISSRGNEIRSQVVTRETCADTCGVAFQCQVWAYDHSGHPRRMLSLFNHVLVSCTEHVCQCNHWIIIKRVIYTLFTPGFAIWIWLMPDKHSCYLKSACNVIISQYGN